MREMMRSVLLVLTLMLLGSQGFSQAVPSPAGVTNLSDQAFPDLQSDGEVLALPTSWITAPQHPAAEFRFAELGETEEWEEQDKDRTAKTQRQQNTFSLTDFLEAFRQTLLAATDPPGPRFPEYGTPPSVVKRHVRFQVFLI